jgi:hypothetical protein
MEQNTSNTSGSYRATRTSFMAAFDSRASAASAKATAK